ncbi:MAG: type II secretion system protein [Oscillospiraceae bacterium]|nr:type II secretion system protein [Oscillospiraceae bacterium]
MKKLQELRKNKKGFTLVEIIVVLAILAILIAVALPNLNGVLEQNRAKVMYQDARVVYVAAQELQLEQGDDVTFTSANLKALAAVEGTPIVGFKQDASHKITDVYYMNDAKNGGAAAGTTVHITSGDTSEILASWPADVPQIALS